MTYVYVLSTYQEDGMEYGHATLERDHVQSMLCYYFPAETHNQPLTEATDRLTSILERSDEDLIRTIFDKNCGVGIALLDGWGTVSLYVMELERYLTISSPATMEKQP